MINLLFALLYAVSTLTTGIQSVDVSAHNRDISSLLASEKPQVVFVRAAYGSFSDSRYTTHSSLVLASGARLVAYLFLRPSKVDATPEAQVDHFLRVAANARGYVLDWEADTFISRDGAIGSNGRPSLTELKRAVDEFHAKGLKVGVYASELAPFPHVGQDWDWVANYSRRPRISHDVWQYQGSPIDRDIVYSSLDKLDARPAPAPDTGGIRYVTANYYDCSSLPSVRVRKGTSILDLTGKAWGHIGADTWLCTAGLAEAHTGQYVVLIRTSRYSTNGKPWLVWQRVSTLEIAR